VRKGRLEEASREKEGVEGGRDFRRNGRGMSRGEGMGGFIRWTGGGGSERNEWEERGWEGDTDEE